MGTVGWIILIVVIGAVAAAAAFALMGNRRTEAKREQATELREEAAQSTAAVEASRREAEEAAARAEVARAEAARAEQDAAQAQQGVQVEEARVEDRVRTADDVDPDVDTRAEDYQPRRPHDDGSRDRRRDDVRRPGRLRRPHRDRRHRPPARRPCHRHRHRPGRPGPHPSARVPPRQLTPLVEEVALATVTRPRRFRDGPGGPPQPSGRIGTRTPRSAATSTARS